MLADYDVQRMCRTCLRKADDLIPLDRAPDIKKIDSESVESTAYKTNADLLMECANVEVNSNDGLPSNVCVECVSALTTAFTYKRMCERSDAKLRQIFQMHLNSVRVKMERIDETNDNEEARLLEEHWFDNTISETFDEYSPKIESDDNWSTQEDEDSEKIDATFDPTETENVASNKLAIKIENSTETNDQSTSTELAELLKNAKCENGSWICKICNKTFRNRRTLKLHIRRQNHLKQHGQVNGCDSVKISRQPILRLKKVNPMDGGNDEDVKLLERAQCVDGRWVCEICKKTFADRNTLKLHIRVHLGINLKQCPNCPKGFVKQSFLDFHMKSHEMKDYPCQNCDRVFNSKQSLRDHTSDVHKVEKPQKIYMCEICSKVFTRVNTLNQHRITHTGEKKFSCEICHRKLGTKASLQMHMRLHGDRAELYRFLCPHCGRKFTTGAHMAGHVRAEHTKERPYKCESCDLAFHRYDNWAQHRLKHVNRYVCKTCGKSLSSKFRLISHTRMHTGEKPHKCTVCDQAFATWKSLKSHLVRHSGDDVPNKCNVCENVFGNEKQLEKHRRQFDHQLSANQQN